MSGEYGFQPVNFTRVAITAVPQYHIAQASGGAINCGLATADTQVLLGVVQNVPLAGEHATICPLGRSKAIAGAAVTLGARITSNASGRAVAAGSGDAIIGYAIEAAAADGDVFEAFIAAIGDKMIA